jgi:hypothetical protein
MEFQYEKLMEQEGLTLKELPEDAKVGIESIAKIKRIINLTESKGKTIRQDVYKKLKANDKWVTREILDYLEGKDSNQSDELPHDEQEIKKDIEGQDIDPLGVAVEEELKKLFESDVKEIEADDLKSKAPKTYNVIFKNYGPDEDNGVETSNFTIIETDTEVFTIKKK